MEIHQKLWISQRAEILIFWCISTCGNSSGKVNFRMSICKRIREFPRGNTCGNTRFFGDFHMRKYTRKCEFPHAEIHAERCNTACGNTLNQVQKNRSSLVRGVRSPFPLYGALPSRAERSLVTSKLKYVNLLHIGAATALYCIR